MVLAMYSISKAGEILGRSKTTVISWMKAFDIKPLIVVTDRKRTYIADGDMDILVDHITQQVVNRANKKIAYHKHHRDMLITEEGKFYSFSGAASLLGVSADSVKAWSRQADIVLKLISTDRKRLYISDDDLQYIADLHKRDISRKALAKMSTQRDVNPLQTDMDKLCTIKEVTLYLNISYPTARKWIKKANIEVKTKFLRGNVTCITYRDIVYLADIHKCDVLPSLPLLSVEEEINVMKSKMEKMATDIEDLKHDFRLFVKRSIYVK